MASAPHLKPAARSQVKVRMTHQIDEAIPKKYSIMKRTVHPSFFVPWMITFTWNEIKRKSRRAYICIYVDKKTEGIQEKKKQEKEGGRIQKKKEKAQENNRKEYQQWRLSPLSRPEKKKL